MDTVPITNVSGDDLVIEATGQLAAKGETVPVPSEVAGRAPADGDLGEGLLAQPDKWAGAAAEPVDEKPTKRGRAADTEENS